MKTRSSATASARLSLALAASALIFYIPANVFPFMTIQMYGQKNTTTIWSGVVSLMEHRSYFVALMVFLASILIPVIKLLILFYLGATHESRSHLAFNRKLHRFVESIGRWSMLDIFLLAIMVGLVKLGALAEVRPEPGSALFLLVVIFTMISSAVLEDTNAP